MDLLFGHLQWLILFVSVQLAWGLTTLVVALSACAVINIIQIYFYHVDMLPHICLKLSSALPVDSDGSSVIYKML